MEQNERPEEDPLEGLDLELENRGLDEEIRRRFGGETHRAEDVDPHIENTFLHSVLAYEEAEAEPGIPMRSLFPADMRFPPASSLTPEEIANLLGRIRATLGEHNVVLAFSENLPDAILYAHLIEECIPHETVGASVHIGWTLNLDGCDGYCPGCFQKGYCDTGKEMLADGAPGWGAE